MKECRDGGMEGWREGCTHLCHLLLPNQYSTGLIAIHQGTSALERILTPIPTLECQASY